MPRRLFCFEREEEGEKANAECGAWNADYERRTAKRGLFGTDLAAFSEYAERPARSIQSRSGNTGGGPAGPGCICCRLAWFCAKVDRKSPGANVPREKAARGTRLMEKREKRFGYSLFANGYRRAVVPLERGLRVQCRIVTRELPLRAHAARRAFAISRQWVAPRATAPPMAYRSITPSAFIRLIVSMTSFMPTLREFR